MTDADRVIANAAKGVIPPRTLRRNTDKEIQKEKDRVVQELTWPFVRVDPNDDTRLILGGHFRTADNGIYFEISVSMERDPQETGENRGTHVARATFHDQAKLSDIMSPQGIPQVISMIKKRKPDK